MSNEFDGFDRVIDTHIKNLRQKIEDSSRSPVYIMTVHGTGYKFGVK
ncbi:MAG: helix-turn-helix domain-containing protein [Oscillospiraceae bacterium]|nr:helix-turn-helix domain-containing protein [Oscillospiraceae bacterium]